MKIIELSKTYCPEKFEDYSDQKDKIDKYKNRIINYRNNLNWLGKIKRRFNWFLFDKAFCPECNRVTEFESIKFVLGIEGFTPEDEIPLYYKDRCTECNLTTPAFGLLPDKADKYGLDIKF